MTDHMSKDRLLFVIQRFGNEVDGGAELYCRWLASHLKDLYEIDILTTCATSYRTWANVYPPGTFNLDGLTIIRKQVSQEREINTFNDLTHWILSNPHEDADESRWLEAQGPYSPGLIEFIDRFHQDYRALLFFTYLYYPTVAGAQIAPQKSILIPTAHDEPVAHLRLYKNLYSNAAGLLFLTYPEAEFVNNTYVVSNTPQAYVGTGIELPEREITSTEFINKYSIVTPMILYVGRVEEGKGCLEAAHQFTLFCEKYHFSGNLVFAGKQHMNFPDSDRVRFLGFIPDGELHAAFEASDIVIIPSQFESLSILLLQAFACNRPVLVNGRSAVLTDHCIRSNGGLFYRDSNEFCFALELMLNSTDLRLKMGQNGLDYIKKSFHWDFVRLRVQHFLDAYF